MAPPWRHVEPTFPFSFWSSTARQPAGTVKLEESFPYKGYYHDREIADVRVRVWISGAEGSSHDFELVDAPRIGDRVVVGVGSETEEGIVEAVTWHLQAIDPPAGDLPLAVEPLGAVTIVQVICRPETPALKRATEGAAIDLVAGGSAPH